MSRMQALRLPAILFFIAVITLFKHVSSAPNYKQSKQDTNATGNLMPSLKCDCGLNGICDFEYGEKNCHCIAGYQEKDGKCIECDCGPQGICFFENGEKNCNCNRGFRVQYGRCRECDCGMNGDCSFDDDGNKTCDCDEGFSVMNVGTKQICVETCDSDDECGIGGKCIEREEKKFCKCKSGIEGDKCEIITECLWGKFRKCAESGGLCYFDGIKAICKCPYDKKFDPRDSACRENCWDDTDCYNGGKCDPETEFCFCKPKTYGDKCEYIEGCESLKCGDIIAGCVYDVNTQQPTCSCFDDNYYYNNGKCNPKWCLDGCNSAVSICEYRNGVGICKCRDANTYYDYSKKICLRIDPCFSVECRENQICSNGMCKCDENYKIWNGTCESMDLCEFNKCFIGARCEEDNNFGRVRCFCKSDTEFYLNGKCLDGSCFLPGQRKDCKKSCPAGMTRINGECELRREENKCDKDCGFLGWCYRVSDSIQKCVCDPNYAEKDPMTDRCVLKSVVCPMRRRDGDSKCSCTGKYKLAKNGITCELKSCSDEDVLRECKSRRAEKCVDNWKHDGYRCVCPLGYMDHKIKGCIDPCSVNMMKDTCSVQGQLCYIGIKDRVGDCRCPPTFTYDTMTKTCKSSNNTFMIRRLPVLKKMYEFAENNINQVLLSRDAITSMMQTFNNLDFAHVFNYRIDEDVLFCDVWLQFNPHLPDSFRATSEVQRWKFQLIETRNQLILPPRLLLDRDNIEAVIEEELTLCSSSVFQLVCGTGSICYDNKCDCAPGFRVIDSTIKVSGERRILRCEDIDECSEGIHNCPNNTICINTQGDYYCQCKPGYKKDENRFLVMDKKPCIGLCDPNPCGNGTCQIFEDYSIYCKCDEGFVGPFCEDNIEVKTKIEIESNKPMFIGILTFFCILIMMLSGTLCYIHLNKKKE
ncbi:fibrillin-1-like isoform X2 [Argiope bruennichi]|uniref:fibrillin-1-like isoform X2 n=1 Tax=Argiope bruennichi TaxID=94029 RepID=UPI0024951D3C|nr:fibrillin-1-like isoform X2 [Argiope bruennichi]